MSHSWISKEAKMHKPWDVEEGKKETGGEYEGDGLVSLLRKKSCLEKIETL